MPGTSVIGLQWGDEAKGKLVDLLTAENELVVRFLGGANAGHTVVTGGDTYKLHHVPSGILNPGVVNIIAPGVVLNPPTILQEIESLTSRGIHVGGDNLMLSERMHVVFPWHLAEDRAMNERLVDGESIGTTLRGIGPCYRDKVGRSHGIRLGDLYRADFPAKVRQVAAFKERLLAGLGAPETLDAERIFTDYQGYAQQLEPHVADTSNYLLDAVEQDKRVLYEGAQGALLDIDHGTFPFVTSSNSSGVGVSAGAGVPPRSIDRVIGVAKAYSTRVGGGPFPTEQDNETGQRIRDLGNEYGTTTNRPRRCGWFDAVAVRYTTRLSGVDVVALMMVDVLSHLPEAKICVAYELDGKRIDHFPCHADDLRRVTPIYETLPGWEQDVTGMRRVEDLPQGARDYIQRISELLGRPVEIVSVGPDREQTMFAPLRRMTSPTPAARPPGTAMSSNQPPTLEVPSSRRPRHIAVIMDGNGRWAERQSLPRIEGHRRGVASVRRTVEEAARLNIQQLTLYCLSSENWKRPQGELEFLMHLLEQYMIEERSVIMEQDIVVQIIGRRVGIPPSTLAEMDRTIEMSAANHGTKLCLAINYGGRAEMTDAVRTIGRKVRDGLLDPDAIDESTISEHLYTAGMPDPDLMIRTAGEMRISNFLLWQVSYAELWVTELCWPEFRECHLHEAIRAYASRQRRFGGLVDE